VQRLEFCAHAGSNVVSTLQIVLVVSKRPHRQPRISEFPEVYEVRAGVSDKQASRARNRPLSVFTESEGSKLAG
jgi:hypothetical protein